MAEKKKREKKERTPRAAGLGIYAKELIVSGKTNQEAFVLVKKKFPTSNTNVNCMTWYRNKLRAEGKIPKVAKAPKAAKPAKKASKKKVAAAESLI